MARTPGRAIRPQDLDRIAEALAAVGGEALGHRFRRLREGQGVSIRAVADAAGVSKNSVVRFEQGRGTLPLTVAQLCRGLGIHLPRLLQPPADDGHGASHRRADDAWYDHAEPGAAPLDLRRAPVPVAVSMLQSRLEGGHLLPAILELRGASRERQHPGEEFVYVLQGIAEITVAAKVHRLAEGESLAFWGTEPHRYAPAKGSTLPVRLLTLRAGA